MTAAKRPQPENKPSSLLSLEENDQLFKLIGLRCKSMASAVVQVCFADPPSRSQWNLRHCGVLCFIKDNIKRSYYLRVFCLDRQSVVWEQELYSSFEYCAPRPHFHTFEGDDCRVGLNFANDAEAEFFLVAIKENMRIKSEKRERRRLSQQQLQPLVKPTPVATNGSASKTTVRTTTTTNSVMTKKSKKDKNKKITKADIGLPSDFKHLSHVGWDPNQGFALDNVDPNLLKFFARAGISESHLKDKATREFIYDFIDKHGGKEAAIREISSLQPNAGLFSAPPVPARNPPSTPQTARMAPPAPPMAAPPPPPSRIIASPPPIAPPAPPQRAPPPKMAPITTTVPPPPPVGAPPPPPPPPPLPSFGGPPPPPIPSLTVSAPSPSSSPAQPDVRSALMDAIKEGHKLKSVPADSDSSMKAGPKASAAPDTRNDLLGQIRAGKELKPVEKKASSVPVSDDVMEGMAGALARALEERCRVIHSDSDESGQDQDEDDDWDD